MSEDPKSPAEELVDLVVFGPLGMALEYLERFPDFVARGRKQANFAQSIGKMALGGLSRRPSRTPAPQSASATPVKATEPPQPAAASRTKSAAATKATGAATKATGAATKATGAATAATPASASKGEPIPRYSTMTAREIIAAVGGLTQGDLGALESAEKAGKNRVTVLRAIDAQRSS